jgi:hypothetical protein
MPTSASSSLTSRTRSLPRQRIFERLYPVDQTRDRATGGVRLGLAIASRAAHSLGGRTELESTPGRGSEFRLIVSLDRGNEHRDDQDLQATVADPGTHDHGRAARRADRARLSEPVATVTSPSPPERSYPARPTNLGDLVLQRLLKNQLRAEPRDRLHRVLLLADPG